MAKYIPLDTLVAEIERRIELIQKAPSALTEVNEAALGQLYSLNNFLNSFNVKEVDLEKELIQWHKNHFERNGTFIGMNGIYLENASQIDIARHFFELGVLCQINNINIEEVKAAAKAWSEDDENTRGCDYIGAVVAERAFVACAEWLINKAQKGKEV